MLSNQASDISLIDDKRSVSRLIKTFLFGIRDYKAGAFPSDPVASMVSVSMHQAYLDAAR